MKADIKTIFIAIGFFFLLPTVVDAGVFIKGKLKQEKSAEAGETYDGVILVSNSADEPLEVKVYQTDYLFFYNGTKLFGEPGKNARSNSEWITFYPKRFTVPPKGESSISYTVKIPKNETLTGTYWSMLMIEELSISADEEGKPKEDIRVNIRQAMRFGIQMITHIGDSGMRKLNFLKTKVLKKEETKTLQVDIENCGERSLIPYVWTELYDEEGRLAGRYKGEKYRIYPGTSARFEININDIPEGQYMGLLVADCGDENVFGVEYTLKLK